MRTTVWCFGIALAMLLTEPVADTGLGPVRGKAGQAMRVKYFDTMLDCLNEFLLGRLKGFL